MCDIKKSFIGLVFLAGRSNFEKGRWEVEIIVLARYCCRLYWQRDSRMTLKNGFGKCSLFVLSVNGWKDQNMDSSFSRQRKP